MNFSLTTVPVLGAFVQQICVIRGTYFPFVTKNVLYGVLGAGIAMVIFSEQKLAGIILIVLFFVLSQCL